MSGEVFGKVRLEEGRVGVCYRGTEGAGGRLVVDIFLEEVGSEGVVWRGMV